MLRVGSIVIRVENLDRQMDFWSAALGYEVGWRAPLGDFAILRPPAGTQGPNVSLDCARSDVHIPPRIHLDLYASDQAAEVERLVALGASRVEWSRRPPDADYVILSDPEGNRFCVVDAATE